jgi:hypothetical protein
MISLSAYRVPVSITGLGTFRMELFVSKMPFNLMSGEQLLRLGYHMMVTELVGEV